jgi:hypothetical protein
MRGYCVPVDMIGVFGVFDAFDATDATDAIGSCDAFGWIDIVDFDVDLGEDDRIPARPCAGRRSDC